MPSRGIGACGSVNCEGRKQCVNIEKRRGYIQRKKMKEEGRDTRSGMEAAIHPGKQERRVTVVMVSTEVAPWSKVGGLGDVMSALPKAMVSLSAGRNGNQSGAGSGDQSGAGSGNQSGAGSGNRNTNHYHHHQCIDVMTVAPLYEEYTEVSGDKNNVDGSTTEVTMVPLDLRCDMDRSALCDNDHANGECEAIRRAYGQEYAELVQCMEGGVRRVFVRHPLLYAKNIYQASSSAASSITYVDSGDVCDLDVRYSILCQGALVAGAHAKGKNEESDLIFVLNDWPTALVALRLKYIYQNLELEKDQLAPFSIVEKELKKMLKQAKTVFCIHNLAYQGIFPGNIFPRLCLPEGAQKMLLAENSSEGGTGESDMQASLLNFMRAGLMCSDAVVTVSQTYANEIMTDLRLSCGLLDILQYKGVRGIMNGLDTVVWNPKMDPLLPPEGRYTAETADEKKRLMKQRIQERLGLYEDPDTVLFVFIGRLTSQKGVDVMMQAFERILPRRRTPLPNMSEPDGTARLQFVVLGTGAPSLEAAVNSMSAAYTGYAAGICQFSEELAHWLHAAADFMLVPSEFEPCGLIAQSAARYGAIPICTATGGLKDLADQGIGYTIPSLPPESDIEGRKRSVDDLSDLIERLIELYRAGDYAREQEMCMNHDFAWEKSAIEWIQVLTEL